MKYITTDYSECEYITANKLYPVLRSFRDVYCILADNNTEIPVTIAEESAHLGLEGRFQLIEVD